jgi:large subunit ribosomal protein L1
MAKRSSKNIAKARALVEPRPYALSDAVPLLQKAKYAKFDETVDLTLRLGVDPRHADQMVRGTVVLPHGLGKTKIVAVIASGDKIKDAEAAGAEFFGGEELVEKIQKENWTAFDALISTPDMMKSVGRLGKVLGPKGLMPTPRPARSRPTSPPRSRRSRPARSSSAPTRRRWSTFPWASSPSTRRSSSTTRPPSSPRW